MAGSAKGLTECHPEVLGGVVVKQFDIQISKKPSAVAGIAEALAQNGVSIRGISSETTGNNMMVKIITDDEATTRATLVKKKATFSEREALSVVIHDRPGEIAKLTRRLARRMVLIESIYMLSREGGMTEVAFTANDMEKAQAVLKAWKG